ncbi:MAG: hypothetical protein ACK463_26560, partial [Bradyrhizobium sp.]
ITTAFGRNGTAVPSDAQQLKFGVMGPGFRQDDDEMVLASRCQTHGVIARACSDPLRRERFRRSIMGLASNAV